MKVKSIVGLLLLSVVVGCSDNAGGPAIPAAKPATSRPKGEGTQTTADADGNVVEGDAAAGKTQPPIE